METKSEFDYNSAYFDGKLSDWTAMSIGAISGKLLNTLKTQPFPRDGVVLDERHDEVEIRLLGRVVVRCECELFSARIFYCFEPLHQRTTGNLIPMFCRSN